MTSSTQPHPQSFALIKRSTHVFTLRQTLFTKLKRDRNQLKTQHTMNRFCIFLLSALWLLVGADAADFIISKFAVAVTAKRGATVDKEKVAEILHSVVARHAPAPMLPGQDARSALPDSRMDLVKMARRHGLSVTKDQRYDYKIEYASWRGIAPLPTPKIVQELAVKLSAELGGTVTGVSLVFEGGNEGSKYAFPGLIPTPSP